MVAPSGGGGVEGERTRVQCRLTRWHHASTAVAAAHGTDVTAGSLAALLSTSSGARSGRTAAGHGDPPHACCAPPRPAHPGSLPPHRSSARFVFNLPVWAAGLICSELAKDLTFNPSKTRSKHAHIFSPPPNSH